MNIINSKSLLNYNTFKIDAYADLFTEIKNQKDIIEILKNESLHKKEILILGGGSNILLTKNITGLVIHNQIKGIQIIEENKETVVVEVGSGEEWDNFVNWSTKNNFYGVENLSLIPGSVGAAPIQNIGAYGTELKNVFLKLEAINLKTKEIIIFKKNECEFGYRDSIFKKKFKNKFIITKVWFQLSKIQNINTNYKALKTEIERLKLKNPTSQEIRSIIIDIRNSKLPKPREIGNAGSFFKNPIIQQQQLHTLQQTYPNIPFFKKTEIKIPAAWLIENANWKGYKNSTCGVYEKHALVIINHNKANGQDILMLANKIKQSVYQKFNITLEEEVLII